MLSCPQPYSVSSKNLNFATVQRYVPLTLFRCVCVENSSKRFIICRTNDLSTVFRFFVLCMEGIVSFFVLWSSVRYLLWSPVLDGLFSIANKF